MTATRRRRTAKPCPQSIAVATLDRRRQVLEGKPGAAAELAIVLKVLNESF
jgi:hypothetical protein